MTVLNKTFTNEDAARRFLEANRWPTGPVCPFCGQQETVKALPPKGSMGEGWFHCRECREKFTVRVGTLYERSHVPLHKWLYATHLICSSKKGISSHQLHRMLGVTYKTAWFMSHRIREGMKPAQSSAPMGGEGKTIEADESFIGQKAGKKVRRGGAHKHAIFSLVERNGRARSFHVPNIRGETLRAIMEKHTSPKSDLMTDEAPTYTLIGWNFASHGVVKHRDGEYARGHVSTNSVEGFFSIFKRGMIGTYQHCSEAHLQRYLTEFDFRYSNRAALGVNDTFRTEIALKGIEGRRLTYRRTVQA